MVRRSRRSVLAALGAASAALAGCTAGYRSAGSGTVDAQSSLEPTSTAPAPLADAPLSPAWETEDIPGQYTLSTPGFDGERFYLGSETVLTAIDVASGEIDWQVDIDAFAHGFTPAVTEAAVVASARDIVGRRRIIDRGGTAALHTLDPATGEAFWREELPVSASPVVDEGTVFVPLVDDDGTAITARNFATGDERWTTRLETPEVFSAPAVGDGVYAATVGDDDGDGRLVALARDGQERWTLELAGDVYKGPAVAAGPGETVYVGTTEGYLYAVAADGEVRWRASLAGPVNTTPAVDDRRVYTTTPDHVVALDRATGEGLWSGAVDSVDKTGVGLGGGMVHAGGNEVAAFDAATGEAHWRVELPGAAGTFGSPVWHGDRVHTGACIKKDGSDLYDHVVYALE